MVYRNYSNSETPWPLIKPVETVENNSYHFNSDHDRHSRWSRLNIVSSSQDERVSYLEATQAIPVSAKIYAAWLYTYIRGGGKITNQSNRTLSTVTDSPPDLNPDELYKNTSILWMPTRSTDRQIPTGYGANAMQLLVIPHIADINLEPSSGDIREGWEYGHGRVNVLKKRRLTRLGFIATTNNPDFVEKFQRCK